MKLTLKRMIIGAAAAGLLAGGLAAGGAALASSSPTPVAATAAAATGPGTGICGGYGMRAGQQVMTAAADYLGLSLTQLRTQLHQGTSLADIARERGKPVSGLKDAILAAMTSRINANTALTAAQKTALISQFKNHLDAMINTSMGMGRWADTDTDTGTGMGMGAGLGGGMARTGSPMGGMRS